jgi:hypothetical protein
MNVAQLALSIARSIRLGRAMPDAWIAAKSALNKGVVKLTQKFVSFIN